jgi:hypothetical protein
MSNYFTKPDGFRGERNDCTVRAFSTAAQIPYQDAHAAMELAGRRRGHAVSLIAAVADLSILFDIKSVFNWRNHGAKITVATFLKRYPKGRYLCRKSGHAFAVADGVAFDIEKGARVTHVWTIANHA